MVKILRKIAENSDKFDFFKWGNMQFA